jgi:alanine-synthesizing transaminase
MSQKKSVIFKNLLPVIKQYQQAGFTHEKIVAYFEINMILI